MVKLLIWGTGYYAGRFIQNQNNEDIIGFIETNRTKASYMGRPVYSSREIQGGGVAYDYIIVANSYAAEICSLCRQLGMDMSKLIFLCWEKQMFGCTDIRTIESVLSEANYTSYCAEFGLESEAFVKSDAEIYKRLNKRPNFAIQEHHMWPVVTDKYAPAGTTGNYFWQDLWAAKAVIKSGAAKHFDIGSRLDGFIAHLLSAGVEVTMIDVRKFPGDVEGLHAIVDDATALRQIPDGSMESMSALCSLEHFGLGRYGDPVDPEACFKCFENMQRKLKKGGRLYLSLPVGKERVEFNAHRVFYASTVLECFSSLHLDEFSCTAEGRIEYNADIHKYDNDMHNGEHRYGLFRFVK